jgi:hypothetical protein
VGDPERRHGRFAVETIDGRWWCSCWTTAEGSFRRVEYEGLNPTDAAPPDDTARPAKPVLWTGFRRYRYGDSNPGFRRERAAS